MSKFIKAFFIAALLFCGLSVNAQVNNQQTSGDTTAHSSVDVLPEFKGGEKAFVDYLTKAIVYPMVARKKNVQGRIILVFTVEKDGSLTNIRVVKKVSPEIDAEAVRVIRESPHWIPGTIKGQPVRTLFAIPLNFNLTGK
ncbi:energy transducer TonB [Mucilaginibacter sp. ZT4R22]|uniref:Energy transducer TonB n=1 Tax=Mucilaginibacter pankratovii TaxID=2772110 RepID=A0ABR7WU79_9SPHI|nr:energy transducer TonB [Mucilaginibacter pankratovii]MBD1365858.1 energy transducer TonB [Mucilaginibacter pankratovii]